MVQNIAFCLSFLLKSVTDKIGYWSRNRAIQNIQFHLRAIFFPFYAVEFLFEIEIAQHKIENSLRFVVILSINNVLEKLVVCISWKKEKKRLSLIILKVFISQSPKVSFILVTVFMTENWHDFFQSDILLSNLWNIKVARARFRRHNWIFPNG